MTQIFTDGAHHFNTKHPYPLIFFPGFLMHACIVIQSCLTLCDPMDCSPPGSSVHGILQVRILEWVAMPFSRGPSRPRDRTQVSCIAGEYFTTWAPREAFYSNKVLLYLYLLSFDFSFPVHEFLLGFSILSTIFVWFWMFGTQFISYTLSPTWV